MVETALSEIAECVDMTNDVENKIEQKEVSDKITEFLDSLDSGKRIIFLLRYWNFMSVKEIAQRQEISEVNVRTSLHRTRNQLKKFLEKNGLYQ